MRNMYLGIDVGSVTTKVVLIDDENGLIEKMYLRTNGQPVDIVKKGLKNLKEKYSNRQISGVGVTGSARSLIGLLVGADIIKNEITSHAFAAINHIPDVRTIIEIGGQDSKIIMLQNQIITDFAMNSICAAGTGSFLDQQAFRLKIPIEEFGEYALQAKSTVRIAGRCTVFAESDMIHKQQLGFGKPELVKGLCEALVRNYLNNVAKGKDIKSPILFQGGVAYNNGIKEALKNELKKEIIIPQNFEVMGAIGAALLAKEHIKLENSSSKFRGMDLDEFDFNIAMKLCNSCTNNCEITEVLLNGAKLASWGSRCGKE